MLLLIVFLPMLLLWIGTLLAVPHARRGWQIAISTPAVLGLIYTVVCIFSVFRPGAPDYPQWPIGIMLVGAVLLPIAGLLILVGLAPSRRRRPDH